MLDNLDGMTSELKQTYKCRYCEKEFRKESSLMVHLCEPKRRWQQEKEVGVQLGLKAYLRFYEMTQGSAKLKSYEDFVKSPYYNAFVKWGRHCVGIRAVNPGQFLEWLLKNNKKIDHWLKDEFYVTYLHEYLRREAVQDALERALKEMQDYADDHPELKNGFTDYFRYGKYGDKEVEPTKKEFAEFIKDKHPIVKAIMFAMWDGKDYNKIIWKALKPEYRKL